MSVIAHCAVDGQVNLAPEHVLMAPTGTGVSYSWWCPTCWEHRTRPADAPLVALLIRGGVALSGVAPEYAQHDGPALTDDDLDVFVVNLRTVDWVVVQASEDVHRIPTADAGGTS